MPSAARHRRFRPRAAPAGRASPASRGAARRWRGPRRGDRSKVELGDDRHMVRRLEPRAAPLAYAVRPRLGGDGRARPHMVEPSAAVRGFPVPGAVAPPGEAALRRGDEAAAEIDPAVRRLQPGERLDLDRRVADDVGPMLVAPNVPLATGGCEIA